MEEDPRCPFSFFHFRETERSVLTSPSKCVAFKCSPFISSSDVSDYLWCLLSMLQMFDIMKRHSANLVSSMKKKVDEDEPLEMKE